MATFSLCIFSEWWAFLVIIISLLVSILALAATFYQAYLQRVHNEKSLKPFGQVDLGDLQKHIFVYITNNGMGPMLIDRLVFTKHGRSYDNIESCLDLAPRSYRHILLSGTVKKVLLPNLRFEVFEMIFEGDGYETEMANVKNKLTPITLTVYCTDIYDNKFSFEGNFEWFSRHKIKENQPDHQNI